MPASEMQQAILEFERIIPEGCVITPTSHEIYTLVKVDGWPRILHYEFRFSQEEGLFVEFHIEDERYLHVGDTLRQLAEDLETISGHPLEYFPSRPSPNRKIRPSLSIRIGHGNVGQEAAEIMNQLIGATRGPIQVARGG